MRPPCFFLPLLTPTPSPFLRYLQAAFIHPNFLLYSFHTRLYTISTLFAFSLASLSISCALPICAVWSSLCRCFDSTTLSEISGPHRICIPISSTPNIAYQVHFSRVNCICRYSSLSAITPALRFKAIFYAFTLLRSGMRVTALFI